MNKKATTNGAAEHEGSSRADTARTDCVGPPREMDAEKGLLGSIMLERERLDEVSLVVKAADFYLESHQHIFTAAMGLHVRGKPVDAITVAEMLQKKKLLKNCGGPDYLIELYNAVPHAAHAAYYAKLVAAASVRRKIIYAATDCIADAHNLSLDVDDVTTRSEARLIAVIEARVQHQTRELSEILHDAMARLEEKRGLGLMTGYRDVDEKLCGLADGSLTILAARPSMGKTAWAGNVAMSVAQREVPVGFVSLEQPEIDMADRFLSTHSSIPLNLMRKGELDDHDRNRLVESANRLAELEIHIDDCRERRDMATIEASCRIMARKRGVRLLVIDYLQIISPSGGRNSREQEVADISRRLKLLAVSLNLPVLCLSQLNREVEKRDNKRPRLSDLRESGAIEQDADNVLFLHRPEYYDVADKPGIAEMIVGKQRNGPTGIISLAFAAQTMTFRDTDQPVDPQMQMPFT